MKPMQMLAKLAGSWILMSFGGGMQLKKKYTIVTLCMNTI